MKQPLIVAPTCLTVMILCCSGMAQAATSSSSGGQRAAPPSSGPSALPPPLSWDTVQSPTTGPAQSIGSPANGCQSGAQALPLDGPGYAVLRPQRHRYYGQPDLIAFVEHLGQAMAARGYGTILVGDLSQPRGGPMPQGHASHQTGLDVDVWLKVAHGVLDTGEREQPTAVSMVQPGATTTDPARWGAEQEDLVRLAAQTAGVNRIFVNPAIKATLCQRFGDDATWLQRLRPWFGHDEHIHIRLNCPAGAAGCEEQPPPPSGSGCGAELASWLSPPPQPVATSTTVSTAAKPAKPRRQPPEACLTLLQQDTPPLLPASASR